jgi:hypothetical protein
MLCQLLDWQQQAGAAQCTIVIHANEQHSASMSPVSHLAGMQHRALVVAGTKPRPQGGPGEGSAALAACQAQPLALLREGASQEVLPLLAGALCLVVHQGMLAGQHRGRQAGLGLVRPRVLLALLLVLLLLVPLLQVWQGGASSCSGQAHTPTDEHWRAQCTR